VRRSNCVTICNIPRQLVAVSISIHGLIHGFPTRYCSLLLMGGSIYWLFQNDYEKTFFDDGG
jgi:hypothetical protein